MAFVDLEKAFDWVPRKVIWWALRKLGVEEWIVRLVQRMYANGQSLVRVGEGTTKSLKWRLVFTRAQYSTCFSLSLCLKPYQESSALGSPGGDLYANDLVIIAELLEECVLDMERSNGKERTESKCRKEEDHDLQYWLGLLQASFYGPSVTLEWAATASAMAASTGCTRIAVGSRHQGNRHKEWTSPRRSLSSGLVHRQEHQISHGAMPDLLK